MSGANNKLTFSIRDQPCVKVVVFTDRAEVQRLLRAKLKKGENEIAITSISSAIDRDSVRVEGRGQASVLDVVCQDRTVQSDNLDNISGKEKELKNELKELEAKRDLTSYKLERVNKQINILNEFAVSLSKEPTTPKTKDSNAGSSLTGERVDGFLTFLDTYSTRLEKLDLAKYELDKELLKINEQIQAVNDNLYRLSSSAYNQTVEITILAEAAADDTEVEFFISYLVFNASWQPKYDIRVFNKDKSMVINYFGVITQSTGEDWNDTKLSLSTAVPSVGGNVPELHTQNVQIKPPPRPINDRFMMKSSAAPRFRAAKLYSAESALMADQDEYSAAPMAAMAFQTTEVQTSSVGSTSTFEIPRNSTIPSDNTSHKVTIGIINLKPEFEYETVPRKNTYAYIKAKVTNTSEYPLLAGNANVFLDNNFVSKTELKAYSPMEEFSLSLGVDPAIRIDYKPVKKFNAQSGGLLTQKTITVTYHQIIEVKNTTSNHAKILLSDSLPLSNDDKINVKLIEPNLKLAQNNVKINKSNNLEFDLTIPANKTEEISIKYTIDHPADKEIEFF